MESTWHGPMDIQRKFLPVLNNEGITAMISGHLHRYIYAEPQTGLHDFPIIINEHNTALEISANEQKATVLRKDTKGNTLNSYNF